MYNITKNISVMSVAFSYAACHIILNDYWTIIRNLGNRLNCTKSASLSFIFNIQLISMSQGPFFAKYEFDLGMTLR